MGRKNKQKRKGNSGGSTVKKSVLRSEIMQVFRESPNKQFNYKQLAARLGLTDPESRKTVIEVAREMADLDLLKQPSTGKFTLHPSQIAVIEGVIDFIKSGAAYVTVESSKEDIFIPASKTGLALNGDTVEVSITGGRRGKPEGKVIRMVNRNTTEFVGVLELSQNHAFLVPSNNKIHTDFYIEKNRLNGAKNGEKVIAKILDWTDPKKSPFAEVVTVLGQPGDNDVEMHAILAEFGLPLSFPDNVVKAANDIDVNISQKEIDSRRDMRSITTFTIDPDDAKDFDDALSLRSLGEGTYEVGIHIADVSHYVKPGSILDQEAVKRATSVYLVDRVVPMLPEVLSNYVCSLRPNEDKLCMSAVFEISENGTVKKEWFGKTIINSDKRFTYEDAQAVIEGKSETFADEVLRLNRWAEQMRKDRIKNGALEFSGTEVKFKLDENGKPIGVYQKHMKEANFLIEEFMLLANKRVAAHVGRPKKDKKPRPFVYRIHDTPDPEKLKTLRDFVSRLGYKLESIKPENASFALNNLLHQVKGKTEEEIVKQMSIRSMSKAVYSTDNIGHYGLAFDFYTHFTSPIRRYPDVMVHRLIHDYRHSDKNPSIDGLEKTCKHSSNMEKKATDAERASIKYKQVEYMIDKIGDVFDGSVSGLTKWGMYVELTDSKVEGMVPLNTIDDDTYRYDEKTNTIVGARYKEVFEFGDKVRVEVKAADLILKQLDFRLV
ncbi:MAG: ribonuclease R [Cryomorphaceae bacterium]|nr:ribonuclease R [Flavobacteriales bacterium]